jgi:hypothetical protein
MTDRTRTEILAEAEELAEMVLTEVPDMSWQEALAYVWTEADGLYDEYRASAPEHPEPVMKAEREPLLSEVIYEAIKRNANQRAWTQWPSKSLADLEVEAWDTDEGRLLYDAYKSDEGRLPYSQAHERFEKSGQRSVLQILDEWLS